MHNSIVSTELPNADPKLKDWRTVQNRSRSSLRAKILVTTAMAAIIGVFLFAVWRPLITPQISVISIGPAQSPKSSDGSKLPAQIVAIQSLEAFQAFARSVPTSQVFPTQSFSDSTSLLDQDDVSKQPKIIHITGVASVVDDRPTLSPAESESGMRPATLDIADLIHRLAQSRSPSIILVDVIEDESDSISRLPEITAWHFSRCIDRQISQLHDAKVMVITHHSLVKPNLDDPTSRSVNLASGNLASGNLASGNLASGNLASGNSSSGNSAALSPLTQLAIEGFRPPADTNHDGIISVAEWSHVVCPVGGGKQATSATHSFSSTNRSTWKQVVLSPVQPIVPTADAKPSANSDNKPIAKTDAIATSEPAATPPIGEPKIQIDVTAPTLALATAMLADGLGTNSTEEAQQVIVQLRSLLNADAAESDAIKWAASPLIQSATWDEVVWTRLVLSCDVPWPLKQDLIKCRIIANELAIHQEPRQWFANDWQNLQWNRLDAERSLMSPVRGNNTRFVSDQTADALQGYRKMQQDVRSINQATQVCAKIVSNIPRLVASPIHARTPTDDSVCQLLHDTIELQSWLAAQTGSSIHHCTALIQSIQKRKQQYAVQWSETDDSWTADSSVSPLTGIDSGFIETTRTRIARSTLAAQVLLAGAPNSDASLAHLQRDSKLAIDALSSSSYSESQIISSVDQYRRSFSDLGWRTDKPNAETAAANARDAKNIRWSRILNALANDTCELAADSTLSERQQWTDANTRYQRIALAMGLSTPRRLQSDYQLDVTMRGSLALSDRISIEVAVKASSDLPSQGILEVEFDGDWLQVDMSSKDSTPLASRMVGDSAYQTVAAQRVKRSRSTPPSLATPSATIEVQRSAFLHQSSQHEDAAINVRWITDDDIYRTAIPLQLPLADIVAMTLGHDHPSVTASTAKGSSQWIMHANRDRHQHLWLQAMHPQTKSVKVRLLAWPEPTSQLPPTMNTVEKQRWFSSRTSPVELAVHPGLAVHTSEPTKIMFPAAKLDPLAPPIKVGSLWCEVTDDENDVVQMIDLSPRVYRPASLIQPQVSFDHDSQLVDVSIQAMDSVTDATQVHVEVFDLRNQRVIASGDMMVAPKSHVQKSYSAAGCDGHAFGVRVLTDQWPSAFVFHVAGDHSELGLSPSDANASVSIHIPSSNREPFVVPKSAKTVDAIVWVDISDEQFRYGSDQLTLGFDLNGDRYLVDEPSVAVTTPTAIEFIWAGVNPEGAAGLYSQVQPHPLSVPVGLVHNRRVPLIACLQRGDQTIWSNSLTAVFDSLPPKVKEVQIQSPLPSVLGKPVVVEVLIDDAGLSDAASIRAGWATAGQQEFTADVKPLVGQRVGDQHWAIIAPTAALAAGTHTLLVQATDAAGNLGIVKTIAMEIRSESEWIATRQSESTAVRGKIAFVTRPVAGMKVALTRKQIPQPDSSDEKQDNPSEKADEQASQTSNLTQEVLTDSAGNFVFPQVQAGDYELTLEGLYQGMKYVKSVRVAVKPPQPSNISTIRID
ncbi:hypothetical protein K227x_23480 [Rubripirellula lacrimiformis]|uniref:EF-hand domain-containing protein n=1 Tax=Rubripirellula lacrimiformis TaxID=1930273 RepID=A0A517NA07_9BACT|nr:carboxypeptidase regulatory-like domain-containing protein [Rubripirellula lacrimiformis]QDT03962.1 hypothetical protein K227x_23480 [Rubripirellula lacrimiformis]